MKRRKAIATVMAIVTMTSMFGMTVFAEDEEIGWNENGGKATVEGSSWVAEPTIEVELPGDLAFGINPLKLNVSEDETPNTDQIISGEFFVTNYSNIPVAVTATTFVSQADDKVAVLADADWNTVTSELKPVDGKKAIWLVQLYAKSITTAADKEPVATFDAIAGGTSDASNVEGDTLQKATDETGVTQSPIFVLSAWTETVGNQKDSMAAYKFGGAVDPNAAFVEGDITVKTVFELKTLTSSQVENNYEAYDVIGGSTATLTTIKQEKTAAAEPTD